MIYPYIPLPSLPLPSLLAKQALEAESIPILQLSNSLKGLFVAKRSSLKIGLELVNYRESAFNGQSAH